jgi:hypothetical protein
VKRASNLIVLVESQIEPENIAKKIIEKRVSEDIFFNENSHVFLLAIYRRIECK